MGFVEDFVGPDFHDLAVLRLGVGDAGLGEVVAELFAPGFFCEVKADEFAVGGGDAGLVFDGDEFAGSAGDFWKDLDADAAEDFIVFFSDPEVVWCLVMGLDFGEVFVVSVGIPAEIEFGVDCANDFLNVGLVLGGCGSDEHGTLFIMVGDFGTGWFSGYVLACVGR